jgi:hypothetical protein
LRSSAIGDFSRITQLRGLLPLIKFTTTVFLSVISCWYSIDHLKPCY